MVTEAEERELLDLLEEEWTYQSGRKLWTYFPDTGPLRRELYQKHLEFFNAGAGHRERIFSAGNRVGKTESAGLYELALHMTGLYPDWWQGRRFEQPVRAWAAGDTNQTVRDIIQAKLIGPDGAYGTGVLPRDLITSVSPKAGVPGAIEIIRVQHASGGISMCIMKTYEQGRKAFEGTEQHVILLDEEPPLAVYAECLLRTMETASFPGGIVLLTFTPLQGLSDVVLQFMPDGQFPEGEQTGSKYVVNAGWDDVPHLSEDAKEELKKAIPPWQLDARTRGIPALGAGAIFPVPEDDYLVDDFEIPPHWRRAYALDVGWNRTACLWGAYDRDTDTWYLYSEYYRGQAEPSVHATAIKARGEWIPGVIDPAARGRSQKDGRRLVEDYEDLGLRLTAAVNTVEAGIYQVWERLSTGRLKVFSSLANWRKEAKLYRRDEKGNVVKKDDHLMDDTRYLILSGGEVATPVPPKEKPDVNPRRVLASARDASLGWMG
ncbi:MAG: terminase family protein [Xanthomonadales bacterium]|nr:terminase family protein [Xanthomonadales bacterium]